MTTEGEIIELVRDIDVLLQLDTYQGMTDAEIQSIIDYKIAETQRNTIVNAELMQTVENSRAIAAARVESIQAANSVLQSMLEIDIPWVTVGGDS